MDQERMDTSSRRRSVLKVTSSVKTSDDTVDMTSSSRLSRRVSFNKRFLIREFCQDVSMDTTDTYQRDPYITDTSSDSSGVHQHSAAHLTHSLHHTVCARQSSMVDLSGRGPRPLSDEMHKENVAPMAYDDGGLVATATDRCANEATQSLSLADTPDFLHLLPKRAVFQGQRRGAAGGGGGAAVMSPLARDGSVESGRRNSAGGAPASGHMACVPPPRANTAPMCAATAATATAAAATATDSHGAQRIIHPSHTHQPISSSGGNSGAPSAVVTSGQLLLLPSTVHDQSDMEVTAPACPVFARPVSHPLDERHCRQSLEKSLYLTDCDNASDLSLDCCAQDSMEITTCPTPAKLPADASCSTAVGRTVAASCSVPPAEHGTTTTTAAPSNPANIAAESVKVCSDSGSHGNDGGQKSDCFHFDNSYSMEFTEVIPRARAQPDRNVSLYNAADAGEIAPTVHAATAVATPDVHSADNSGVPSEGQSAAAVSQYGKVVLGDAEPCAGVTKSTDKVLSAALPRQSSHSVTADASAPFASCFGSMDSLDESALRLSLSGSLDCDLSQAEMSVSAAAASPAAAAAAAADASAAAAPATSRRPNTTLTNGDDRPCSDLTVTEHSSHAVSTSHDLDNVFLDPCPDMCSPREVSRPPVLCTSRADTVPLSTVTSDDHPVVSSQPVCQHIAGAMSTGAAHDRPHNADVVDTVGPEANRCVDSSEDTACANLSSGVSSGPANVAASFTVGSDNGRVAQQSAHLASGAGSRAVSDVASAGDENQSDAASPVSRVSAQTGVSQQSDSAVVASFGCDNGVHSTGLVRDSDMMETVSVVSAAKTTGQPDWSEHKAAHEVSIGCSGGRLYLSDGSDQSGMEFTSSLGAVLAQASAAGDSGRQQQLSADCVPAPVSAQSAELGHHSGMELTQTAPALSAVGCLADHRSVCAESAVPAVSGRDAQSPSLTNHSGMELTAAVPSLPAAGAAHLVRHAIAPSPTAPAAQATDQADTSAMELTTHRPLSLPTPSTAPNTLAQPAADAHSDMCANSTVCHDDNALDMTACVASLASSCDDKSNSHSSTVSAHSAHTSANQTEHPSRLVASGVPSHDCKIDSGHHDQSGSDKVLSAAAVESAKSHAVLHHSQMELTSAIFPLTTASRQNDYNDEPLANTSSHVVNTHSASLSESNNQSGMEFTHVVAVKAASEINADIENDKIGFMANAGSALLQAAADADSDEMDFTGVITSCQPPATNVGSQRYSSTTATTPVSSACPTRLDSVHNASALPLLSAVELGSDIGNVDSATQSANNRFPHTAKSNDGSPKTRTAEDTGSLSSVATHLNTAIPPNSSNSSAKNLQSITSSLEASREPITHSSSISAGAHTVQSSALTAVVAPTVDTVSQDGVLTADGYRTSDAPTRQSDRDYAPEEIAPVQLPTVSSNEIKLQSKSLAGFDAVAITPYMKYIGADSRARDSITTMDATATRTYSDCPSDKKTNNDNATYMVSSHRDGRSLPSVGSVESESQSPKQNCVGIDERTVSVEKASSHMTVIEPTDNVEFEKDTLTSDHQQYGSRSEFDKSKTSHGKTFSLNRSTVNSNVNIHCHSKNPLVKDGYKSSPMSKRFRATNKTFVYEDAMVNTGNHGRSDSMTVDQAESNEFNFEHYEHNEEEDFSKIFSASVAINDVTASRVRVRSISSDKEALAAGTQVTPSNSEDPDVSSANIDDSPVRADAVSNNSDVSRYSVNLGDISSPELSSFDHRDLFHSTTAAIQRECKSFAANASCLSTRQTADATVDMSTQTSPPVCSAELPRHLPPVCYSHLQAEQFEEAVKRYDAHVDSLALFWQDRLHKINALFSVHD